MPIDLLLLKMKKKNNFTFANGEKYVGEWKNNEMHGQGSLTSPDGKIEKGIFKNGKLTK